MTKQLQKIEPQAEVPELSADPMVAMIERIVLDPAADLDKLERMLAMKERMDGQNARVAYTKALSQARAEIPPIIKDATVDFTSSRGRTHYQHETLAGIAKTIDPILSAHGLSYRFRTDQSDGRVVVTCVISHRDGYSEETSLSGSPDQSGSKNSFQAVGSAVTYLQRYTLKAALGLSAEVDDDGRTAAAVDAPPPFDADAAASRIAFRLKRAGSLEELASIWSDEGDTILRIKDERPDSFGRVEQAKSAAKARLAQAPDGHPLTDEIPY